MSSYNSTSQSHFLNISKQSILPEENYICIMFLFSCYDSGNKNIIKSNGGIELQSAVKFYVALNKSLSETLRIIKSTGKYDKCSPAFVYKWHSHFRSGRESIQDDFWNSQPAVIICSIKDLVQDMVNMDRKTTVKVIVDKLGGLCSKCMGY